MKFVKAFIITLCCAALAACAVKPAAASPAESGESAGYSAEPSKVYEIVKPEAADAGCAAETGYYDVILGSESTSNIIFTDYAAEQRYLCAEPSCEHDDESCASFVDSIPGLCFVFAANEKLYLCCRAQSDSLASEKAAHLYEMELDGSKRREVRAFEPGVRLMNFAAASEGSLMLLSASGGDYTLLRLDLESGDTSQFYSYQIPESAETGELSVLGACETGFIVTEYVKHKVADLPVAETADESLRQRELDDNARVCSYYELPFGGGAPRKLAETTGSRSVYTHYRNGRLCRAVSGERPALQSLDCASMQTADVVSDFSALAGWATNAEGYPHYRDNISLRGFVDNFAIINHYTEANDASGAAHTASFQYLVDLGSGEVKETALGFDFTGEGDTREVCRVVADAGERLLVVQSVKAIDVYHPYTEQYALISKADYYASKPAFTGVRMLPGYFEAEYK